MTKSIRLVNYLRFLIPLQLLIFAGCYFYFTDFTEIFKHSARYSGRVSWIAYLLIFYYFARTYQQQNSMVLGTLRKLITIFCIGHFIHLGYVGANVYLNHIQLVPYKLAGGGLAYLLILLYPFFIHKLSSNTLRLLYFYYLGIIIAFTYVARIRGDFEGMTPGWIHYLGLGSIVVASILFSIQILSKKKLL